ncbi:S-ribosylhomocysteine lyase /quorum-sensing autoinducer 2 (AI-2) synthesis protein LuxS [Peptoclostridium litorale DSM 5388]|uniref:S-ribosylhomocysteine lyase n=1 Tax=Peptoclostridium litorale DSM 5388 TaxID=1121324 RepID=A0A069R9N7_PEPLI|nr:S-ribosylhomocysteine lyase [Peptoclostridium litorale]KDR93746.1 S-ribosylhomocysteine lyase LuxS [Peptoclostridium litorale DSM 5388]SIN85034.1 S-ribosylhomocysteine lyase /quorum-sensing autoinducer 2 (AI-2) synthesis protein LuxS [Peptoclostridium litorale DSM 5388]
MKNIVVESFTMDHTAVEAPFVRKCSVVKTPNGDVITKFDLRFMQPNKEVMPTGAIHAIEHLMAGFIREELEGVVDISPMGCRTGFYLIVVGELSEEMVAKALMSSLEKILRSEEVPAANPVQCGNYRDLCLFGAKEYSKEVLRKLKQKYNG